MYLSEEKLKKYTCKLEKKFITDFLKEYQKVMWYDQLTGEELYDTNNMLEFLYDYPEINDKSKQFFYFFCRKTFNDVPKNIKKKYEIKFGLHNCGNEIYNSYACNESNMLINCNGVKYSFGCSKCKFSDHLLYCTEQRHASFMAFNKQITKKRYFELIQLSPEQLKNEPEYVESIYFKFNSLMEYIYRIRTDA